MGNSHSVMFRGGVFRGFTVGVDQYRGTDDGIRYAVTAEGPVPAGGGVGPVVRFVTRAGGEGYEVAAAAVSGGVDDLEAALSWLLRHLDGPAGAGRPNCAALIASAARARLAFHARGGYAVDNAPFVVVTSDAAPAEVPAPADVDPWADVLHADPVPPLVILPAYAPARNPHVVPAGIDPAELDAMTAAVAAAYGNGDPTLTTSEQIDQVHALWVVTLKGHGYAPVSSDSRGRGCVRCRRAAAGRDGVCGTCAGKLAALLPMSTLATFHTAAA